jgi:type II secretory pathway pseudopilin PulG
MTILSTKRSRAYTLLEVLLAIGLGVIFTFVAVPSMAGWWSEHRMRRAASELIAKVQSARLEAEKDGRRQIVIVDASTSDRDARDARAGVHCFRPKDGYIWEFLRFDGRPDDRNQPAIAIDARGRVEPVAFRIWKGERFVEYRFDFLTGHAREGGFSL